MVLLSEGELQAINFCAYKLLGLIEAIYLVSFISLTLWPLA